ncbi:hypothetical protein ABFS82_14G017200 [Erythranthe guttata]|uniref:Uncharacterized protein n=1 Tax=Erythranthe guttata TaxID=4155 RepID=A0A022S2Z6_ERYGU|nr:PREDICTED: uncharacterized protein LOC105961878 [Erythranthe guttata]EYU45655.1 hypothetical protein MIMGU_mgv1a025871mg [Erythranthe guttata]|eukprot:XP_012841598.1 PREDICTED: uncharacterized protein LOC105961878 [Erythranthe guttata]
MAFALLRRVAFSRSLTHSLTSSQCTKFSTSRAPAFLEHDTGNSATDKLHLSPLFSENVKYDMKDCKIELVDDATWHVSSGLADAWRFNNEEKASKTNPVYRDRRECNGDENNRVVGCVNSNKEDPDFDEIEDMRIRGKLFYKLDKDSKEYQEYKFEYHGRRLGRKQKDKKEIVKESKKKATKVDVTPKMEPQKEIKKIKETSKSLIPRFHEVGDSCVEKKQRSLTFNQKTAPYHMPFCLDIYVSKGSARASIIHRATSNVVAVSHSISKDMKFDLGSTKNRSACAAVGKVLAQRALADDIHNVVYTPRKGDKLEGKIKIVVKSIVDGGVDVKVILKQKKPRNTRNPPVRIRDHR